MQYIFTYHSPIGDITLASNGAELSGLWFVGQKYYADTLREGVEKKDLPIFKQTVKWLDKYFSGKNPGFIPPLCMEGSTPFRKRVWEILLEIPYGKTVAYKEIASQIANETGKKPCSQAVGSAVGHNPISLIIPCHRVVGTNGSLIGYAGGIDRKKELLQLEGVDFSKLLVPLKSVN